MSTNFRIRKVTSVTQNYPMFSDNIFYRKQFSITHGLQFIGIFFLGWGGVGGSKKVSSNLSSWWATREVGFVVFYIHGSVHHESNLIAFQQDATVFSLLYLCRQLYIFRVLTINIRRSYNCNYSYWHWSAGSITILCRGQRVAVDPVDQCQKL